MTCRSCGGSTRLGRIRHGIAGLVSAATGADGVPDRILVARARHCAGEADTPACTMLRWACFCAACQCFIPAKIRVGGESCPLGKWQEFEDGAALRP